MTTPNARTLESDAPLPLPKRYSEVDWDNANRSRQHLFMTTPEMMHRLIAERLQVVAETEDFETNIRRDSIYSTILARRVR